MSIRSIAALATCFVLSGCGATATTADHDQLLQTLTSDLPPGLSIDSINDSAIPGLLEVRVGPQIFYTTPDAKHLVMGSIMDREAKTDLTASSVAEVVKGMLEGVDRSQVQTYTPKGGAQRRVYVFTDPSCGYCQRFHNELSELNAAGVEVVYLGYPREGIGGDSYARLSGAFCNPDRALAFDKIMAGEHPGPSDTCLSPVDFHYALANRLQVNGTPSIFDDKGRQIGGYLTATDLLTQLEK